ncbi:MAG: HypC/HybG/HupF family hydrogenase formation chaperone [Desulfobulbus sp.]|nr:HypC/HybG/HupF family hydrogenase formation chaperone [Desulfobulbus sp.]
MCLAVPMQVIALQGGSDDLFDPPTALVESDGVQKEIRLEMTDRLPEVGEYVIIHAGFAIHTLTRKEAEYNLSLMRQMAEVLEREGNLPGDAR